MKLFLLGVLATSLVLDMGTAQTLAVTAEEQVLSPEGVPSLSREMLAETSFLEGKEATKREAPAISGDFSYKEEGDTIRITGYMGDEVHVVIPSEIKGKPVTALDSLGIPVEIQEESEIEGVSILSITFPDTIAEISSLLGYDCQELTSFMVDEGNPHYKTIDGILFSTDETTLVSYPAGKEDDHYVIPETVTRVAEGAFRFSKELATLNIPDSVTVLEDEAFYGSGVVTLSIPGSVAVIGSKVFYGCESLVAVYIQEGVTTLGHDPEEQTMMKGNLTFSQCENLSYVFLPKSLTQIHGEVFDYSSLQDIYYMGSASDWDKIKINVGDMVEIDGESWYTVTNRDLVNANIIFDSSEDDGILIDSWAWIHYKRAVDMNLLVDSLGMNLKSDITRHQIADLLVNMVEKYTKTTLSYTPDVFTDTEEESIWKANEAGIISGRGDGTFDPDTNASRQEMALMTYKAIVKMEEITGNTLISKEIAEISFEDQDDIKSWAREGVAIMASNHIMAGSEGNFIPHSPITVEEALVVNNNVFLLG